LLTLNKLSGEVAETAEGSCLLSSCRVKSSTPGSNPGLSVFSEMQLSVVYSTHILALPVMRVTHWE
jgi:hypothetical protein